MTSTPGSAEPDDAFARTWWRPSRAGPRDPAVVEAAIPISEMRRAAHEVWSWSDYRASPLDSLPGLAGYAGVATLLCKIESGRFGVGSFKALGARYALERSVARGLGGKE